LIALEESKEEGPVDGVLVRKPRTEKKRKQTGGEDEEEELEFETAMKDTAGAQGLKEARSGEPHEEEHKGDKVAKKLWGDTTPDECIMIMALEQTFICNAVNSFLLKSNTDTYKATSVRVRPYRV
jgi:hypothetical protein